MVAMTHCTLLPTLTLLVHGPQQRRSRVSCERVTGGPPGRSLGGFSRICFDTRCSADCSEPASPTILSQDALRRDWSRLEEVTK